MKRLLYILLFLIPFVSSGQEAFFQHNQTTSVAPAYDTDAQAYFTACEAQGYTFPAGWKDEFNDFYVGCKADGVYTSIYEMGHIAHGNFAANKVKMKSPASSFLISTGSPTSGSNGVVFNGTNQRIDTGIPMTALSQNSAGLWVYVQTAATGSGPKNYIGNVNGNNVSGLSYESSTAFGHSICRGSDELIAVTATPSQLLRSIRTASNLTTPARNTTTYSTSSAVSNAFPTTTVPLGCQLNGASFYWRYANCTLSFYMFTHGMTTTNADLLANRIITLLTNTAGL